MKSIYRFGLMLLATLGLFTLQGCENEKGGECPNVSEESTIIFALSNNSLKAATTTVQPSPEECQIGNVLAVVFEENKLVTATEATKTGDKYAIKLDKEGVFDIYVIANADNDLKQSLNNSNLTPTDLGTKMIKTPLDGTKPIVMVTPKFSVGYAEAGKTIDAGTLRLKRLPARIDIYNRVHGLEITSVTYANHVEEGNLMGAPIDANQLLLEKVTKEVATGAVGTAPAITFYTYPSPADEGAELLINGTLNGEALSEPLEISIDRSIESDKVYSVVLNTERIIGEPLDIDNPTLSLIKTGLFVQEWSNATELSLPEDETLSFNMPEFTIQAEEPITVTKEGEFSIVAVPGKESTFTITTTTLNDLAEVVVDGEGVDYITITNDSKDIDADNNVIQLFTVTVAANSLEEPRTVKLIVRNSYDPSLSKAIQVTQEKAEKEEPTPEPAEGGTPLSLFAEFNVNKDGTGFTDSNKNGLSGYFTYKQIIGVDPLPNGQKFTPPAGYRVPNAFELFLLLPYSGDLNDSHQLKVPGYGDTNLPAIKNVSEIAGYAHSVKQYSADYAFSDYSKGYLKVIYAIRLKKLAGATNPKYSQPAATDDKDKVAYRYEYRNNPYESSYRKSIFIITARKIGESMPDLTIEEVANEEFWNDPNAKYEKLELPMDGYNYNPSTGKASGADMWAYYMGIGTGKPDAKSTFGLKITGLKVNADGLSGFYMNQGQLLRLIKDVKPDQNN